MERNTLEQATQLCNFGFLFIWMDFGCKTHHLNQPGLEGSCYQYIMVTTIVCKSFLQILTVVSVRAFYSDDRSSRSVERGHDNFGP